MNGYKNLEIWRLGMQLKEIFNKTRKFKGWVFKRGGKFHRTTRPPDRKTTGFTLIELLVVISVITLLTAFSVPAFISFQRSQTLNTAAGKLKEDLRLLQSKAIASIAIADQSRAWGVHLVDGSNSYQFFYCTPDSAHYSEYRLGTSRCPVSTSTTVSFDASTAVTNFSGESPADLVFDVLTGIVVFNGGVSATDLLISVAYTDGSDSRIIRIGPGGSIGD